MRLIVSEFVSLDGVMEGPERWVPPHFTAEQERYKLEEVLTCEALLLGRRTYETFAAAWPSRTGRFADRMNGMPKHVVSTTLDALEWSNSILVRRDVAAEVAGLKEQPGGDLLVVGSRTLVNELKRHDLVDEYRIMTFPVLLGRGIRLFEETGHATRLKLTDSERLPSGVVILVYEPDPAGGDESV